MPKGIDWSNYLTTPKIVERGREFVDWMKSKTARPIKPKMLALFVKLEEEGISLRAKYLRDEVQELKLKCQRIPYRLYFFALPPKAVKFVWGAHKDTQDEDIEKAIALTRKYQGGA